MTTTDNIFVKIADILSYDSSSPMIFSSGLFVFLFALFALGYSALRNTPSVRIIYVIIFSLYFYYKSSGIYFLLLIVASVSDFVIGRIMHRTQIVWQRKLCMALSIAVNLGMLGYFKYTNFFVEIGQSLFGSGFMEFQNIFLPVGISFFVFQSMSYTIDIYRRQLTPLTNYFDYLFYLSFFPQLVAGPIVRASDFIPQIRQKPLVSRQMFSRGMFLISLGLFKKAIISDYISLNFVDRIFDAPLLYSGFENLMGVYGYALQIYCDFSGYSDMAIGIALLLGFRFPQNFDTPYKSATITEFWRRWHISLSSWLRDYLYISLGGNRHGQWRTYLNLMLTMLLGGLWHGAAIRFVLWGAWHGAGLALHKAWMSAVKGAKSSGEKMHPLWRTLGVVVTFNFVSLGWLLFRADSMQTVWQVLQRIFTSFSAATIPAVVEGYGAVFSLMAVGYGLHFLPSRVTSWVEAHFSRRNPALQIVVLAFVAWGVMQIKSSDIQPFIYFQF